MVKLKVDRYPHDGVVGFQAEEFVYGEWVSLLDTDQVGVFPNYTTTFSVTPYGSGLAFRARWETGVGQFSSWFTPGLIHEPTAEQIERFTHAVIFKAVRFLKLPEAPFGHSGVTEWGMATVRPDFEIEELLYGLRFREWDIDLTTLVTTDDVIRVGLQIDPDDWVGTEADVQRAIDAAISWVADRVLNGVGIA